MAEALAEAEAETINRGLTIMLLHKNNTIKKYFWKNLYASEFIYM